MHASTHQSTHGPKRQPTVGLPSQEENMLSLNETRLKVKCRRSGCELADVFVVYKCHCIGCIGLIALLLRRA